MKKSILTFALLAFMAVGGFAQEKPATTAPVAPPAAPVAPVNPNQADIKFEKLKHDYGTIKQGASGDCEFKFTNTGKEPLIISMCQGSCGCTVPSCPKEPILPGKAGVIKVHYDTKRVGPISKTVAVTSNAKSGNVTISIAGTVEAAPVEEAFPSGKTTTGAPFEKGN